MKLRDIYNTLAELFAPLDHTADWGERDEYLRLAKDYLRSIGGQHIGSGATSHAFMIDMPWGPVVIKVTACYLGVNLPCPKFLNSQVCRAHWLRPLFTHSQFMIQPMAETPYDETDVIASLLAEVFQRETGYSCDTHPANVGIFRGRFVSFDVA